MNPNILLIGFVLVLIAIGLWILSKYQGQKNANSPSILESIERWLAIITGIIAILVFVFPILDDDPPVTPTPIAISSPEVVASDPTKHPSPIPTEELNTLDVEEGICALFLEESNHWSPMSVNFNFSTGARIDEWWKSNAEFTNNKFIWNVSANIEDRGTGGHNWVDLITDPISDRFYFSATGKINSVNREDDFGIIFRKEGGKLYVFRIRDKGGVYRFTVKNDSDWDYPINWRGSTQIIPEQPNKLTVIGINDAYCLFLNDIYVGYVSDSTREQGGFGFWVSIKGNLETERNLEFENIEIKVPSS